MSSTLELFKGEAENSICKRFRLAQSISFMESRETHVYIAL